jgi:hypothetical protein
MWDELREKWFINRVFKDMNAVEKQLIEGLLNLESNHDTVKSITGWKWIIDAVTARS